jgi:hypothetical protein
MIKMTKMELFNGVSRTVNRIGFKFKKHSPEILLVTGVVGVVTSAVMACKATTKVNDILDEAKQMIDNIHTISDNPDNEYTEEDKNKAITVTYAKTGLEFVKIYAPAVLVGTASIACILASHGIIRKRNVALTAAYASIDNSFKEYRNRVVERFGKELDKELKYNIKTAEVEETVVNEDGTETTITKTVQTAEVNTYSDYARFFDETCKYWEKDAEYNLMFLKQAEAQANRLLKKRGRLFLNDVYRMLGMQETQAGQIVGWVYDEHNSVGDNRVDFGIYDLYNEQKRLFVNGYERSLLLDFNVDGDVWTNMH